LVRYLSETDPGRIHDKRICDSRFAQIWR
jgi:hypothetical protein